MPKSTQKNVTEDQLNTLLQNWKEKDISELAQTLSVDDKTVKVWASRLKKSMKNHGMTDDQIKSYLPSKRQARVNVFDKVVISLIKETPKRIRRPKQQTDEKTTKNG